jgi:hypothetical protein
MGNGMLWYCVPSALHGCGSWDAIQKPAHMVAMLHKITAGPAIVSCGATHARLESNEVSRG